MAIVFLCPASNIPTGGIKAIYRQSEALHSNGVESSVFHPEDPNFSCSWFSHNAVINDGRSLNPRKDFMVIPEVWASLFGDQYIKFKYAIYIQNGYLTTHNSRGNIPDDKNGDKHRKITSRAYEKADLLMSISNDTSN